MDWQSFHFEREPVLPTLLLDAEATILYLNRAACRALAIAPGQRIETSFFSHVNRKNLYRVMRDVEEMILYNRPKVSWLIRLRNGLGQWRWFRANARNNLNAQAGILVELADAHT